MDFFDKVGKKISQTSQDMAQKTKNMAETMKLNNMISAEERSINNAYQQIGKTYFETYGENPEQPFLQLIDGINDSKAKIASYAEQVSQIKGSASMSATPETEATTSEDKACSGCDAATTSKAVFCAYCGNKLEESTPESPTTPAVMEDQSAAVSPLVQCSACGQESPMSAAFCAGCGQKMGS